MTTLYKLTDRNHRARVGYDNEREWGPGLPDGGTANMKAIGPGWIWAYTHPLIAAMLNPAYENISDPVLWECDGLIAIPDKGMRVRCASLTALTEVPLPVISTEQRIKIAIACAKEVYGAPDWVEWSDGWLSGSDKSPEGAKREAAMPGDMTATMAAGVWSAGAASKSSELDDAGAWFAAAAACEAAAVYRDVSSLLAVIIGNYEGELK